MKLVTGNFRTEQLLCRLGFNSSMIEKNIVKFSYRHLDICNRKIPYGSFNLSGIKLCSECLVTNGYLNAICALAAHSYCLKHSCCLVNYRAPNRQISWNTSFLLETVLEQKYLQPEVMDNEVLLNSILCRLWNGHFETGLNKPLHLLDIYNFLLLLRFINKFSPNKWAPTKCNNERSMWLSSFNYLLHWPEAIHSLFRHYELHPMTQSSGNGIRASYRDLYDELYTGRYKNTSAYRLIQNAFKFFLQRNNSKTPIWSSNLKTFKYKQYVSRKLACKLIGVREKGLDRYVELGLIEEASIDHLGFRLFNQADVFRLKKKSVGFVNISELSKLLRCNRTVIKELVNLGLLPFISKPSQLHRNWIFDLTDVKKFISQLISKQTFQKVHHKGNELTSLKALSFSKNTIASLLQQMISGNIRFIVNADDKCPLSLKQFVPIQKKMEVLPKGYVSPEQASYLIGINVNAIYFLLKHQFLIGTKRMTNKASRPILLIKKTVIDNFINEFVVKPRNKRGLILVSGPKVDGGAVNIYKKRY